VANNATNLWGFPKKSAKRRPAPATLQALF
jgi:hypothetical protein